MATVITNLFSAIPVFGQDIVEFLWGGFSVCCAPFDRDIKMQILLYAQTLFSFILPIKPSSTSQPTKGSGKGKSSIVNLKDKTRNSSSKSSVKNLSLKLPACLFKMQQAS